MPAGFFIKDGKGGSRFAATVTPEGSLQVTDSRIPPDTDDALIRPFRQYLTDDGTATGSNDMRVAGSAASPIDFWIPATNDCDRYIDSLSFVVADASASLDKFGNITALTNGVKLFYSDQNLGDVVIHEGFKSNFEMIRLSGKGAAPIGSGADSYRAQNVAGASEGYLVTLDFSEQFGLPWGIRLRQNSNEKMVIRIQDSITLIDQFDVIAYGFDRLR